jgi:hypothetical protein
MQGLLRVAFNTLLTQDGREVRIKAEVQRVTDPKGVNGYRVRPGRIIGVRTGEVSVLISPIRSKPKRS